MTRQYAPRCTDVNTLRCLTPYNYRRQYRRMTLAERIRTARLYAKLTQIELAEKTDMRQQVISKLERGVQSETSAIVRIAMVCGVRPEWLDSETGPMITYSRPELQEAIRSMEPLPAYLIEKIIEQTDVYRKLLDSKTATDANPAPEPTEPTPDEPQVKTISVSERRKVNSPFAHLEWRKKENG